MPQVVVVADDLTGAMDTAHGFAAAGHETRVAVGPDGWPEATVVAVNTDSRYADPETAASAVRRAVSDRQATIYKKIDSTLRGNVVAEIDAAIDASDAGVALVAPAFPARRRTTRDGIHRVDGVPLDETAYAADRTAVGVAALPALLSASRHPVVHVDADVVGRGPAAIAAAIDDDRPVLVACDATTDAHLAAIARSADSIDGTVVLVGSGGLAEHVRVADGRGSPAAVPDPDGGGALGIVGSVNERTLAGLDAVPEDEVIAIDPGPAVRDPPTAGRTAGRAAAQRLTAGETAVVTAARNRAAVEATVAAGEACGYEPADVGAEVARTLSIAARTAVARGAPAGLFVTGGDVAVAVLTALDATTVSVTGEAVEAGIPIGVVDDGIAAGVPLVTKAGGFGGAETVVNCLRALDG